MIGGYVKKRIERWKAFKDCDNRTKGMNKELNV